MHKGRNGVWMYVESKMVQEGRNSVVGLLVN